MNSLIYFLKYIDYTKSGGKNIQLNVIDRLSFWISCSLAGLVPYHLVVFQSIIFHHCRWLYFYGHNVLIKSMDGWVFHIYFKICHGVCLGLIATSYSSKRTSSCSSIKCGNKGDKLINLSPEKKSRLVNEFGASVPVRPIQYNMLKTLIYVVPCINIMEEQIVTMCAWIMKIDMGCIPILSI